MALGLHNQNIRIFGPLFRFWRLPDFACASTTRHTRISLSQPARNSPVELQSGDHVTTGGFQR